MLIWETNSNDLNENQEMIYAKVILTYNSQNNFGFLWKLIFSPYNMPQWERAGISSPKIRISITLRYTIGIVCPTKSTPTWKYQ